MRSVLALAACALAASGCGKQLNPAYCASALHMDDPDCHNGTVFLDAAIDAAVPCSSNSMCSGNDPVCDTTKGICVGCITSTQCTPKLPVCDNETCRGCMVDSECLGTGARCLADGTCADSSELIYVDSAAPEEGTCMVNNPCNTITKGIAAAIANSKRLITATGSFNENVQFNNTAQLPLRLDCEPGTTLAGADDAKPILEFIGTSIADVYRLTIKGNQNQTAGVQLTAGGTQVVGLYQVVVAGPPGAVNDSATRTPAPGIEVQAGNLTMKRSMVSGFEPVGVQLEATAGDFDLETNFIYDNGYQKNGTGTAYGGVAILLANAAGSTFGWNTVAFNGNTNNGKSAGVFCSSGLASSTSTGNLFFHNQGGSNNEFSPTCQITMSLQGTDPKFSTPTLPYDLHLSIMSTAAVDKAAQACMNQVDIDGDARPIGAQCDYGADEYHN